MKLKKDTAIYIFLFIFFSGVVFSSCSLFTEKDEIVRIFEYGSLIKGKLIVEIKDSSGKVIEFFTLEKSSTILRYEYSPYNPMQVERVWSEIFIDVENGKKAIVPASTKGGSQYIYSPDKKNHIGTYIFGIDSKTRKRSSSPDVFVSDLPSEIFEFNGEELVRTHIRSPSTKQTFIPGAKDSNIIFSEDFTRIRAVLPKIQLSTPLQCENIKAVPKKYYGKSIVELGFTFLEIDDEEMNLPYINIAEGKGTSSLEIVIVYSSVPKELVEQFKKIKLFK